MVKSYIIKLYDIILPRFCPACLNKLTSKEDSICSICLNSLRTVSTEIINAEYQRKFVSKRIISGFVSQYIFEKDKELQHIIHALKYDKKFQIGFFLGKILGKHFQSQFNDWKINLITPVPLHHLKEAERGFNQSFYITKGINVSTGIPINNRIVKRCRFTQSQTTMTAKERAENVEGAFLVKKDDNLKDKNILLVDDVMTTGATINSCGKVLLESGANRIYAATVALAGS